MTSQRVKNKKVRDETKSSDFNRSGVSNFNTDILFSVKYQEWESVLFYGIKHNIYTTRIIYYRKESAASKSKAVVILCKIGKISVGLIEVKVAADVVQPPTHAVIV